MPKFSSGNTTIDFINTFAHKMLMKMLSKYGSDTDEADDDYLYKKGWVAGPNTTLEGLPQAQPYGYDAALIPGFIREVHKITKSGLKKKQA